MREVRLDRWREEKVETFVAQIYTIIKCSPRTMCHLGSVIIVI